MNSILTGALWPQAKKRLKVLYVFFQVLLVLEGTDVLVNLTDPGWFRTDLGGPHAPNAPESAIPGICGGCIRGRREGRFLNAQDFAGMTLEDAVKKAEAEFDSPYGA